MVKANHSADRRRMVCSERVGLRGSRREVIGLCKSSGFTSESFLQPTGAARLDRKSNHGYPRLERMIPASWDWQKKSKNRSSLLAQFLFLPCPIRTANTPLPSKSPPCSLCPLWLNKILWGNIIKTCYLGSFFPTVHKKRQGIAAPPFL